MSEGLAVLINIMIIRQSGAVPGIRTCFRRTCLCL